LIDGIQIVINRRHRFDLKILLYDYFVKQQIEIIGSARLNKQSLTVIVDARFDCLLMFEQTRG
jgi:hypothetical protein